MEQCKYLLRIDTWLLTVSNLGTIVTKVPLLTPICCALRLCTPWARCKSPLLGVCSDASLYSLLTCSYLAASKNTLARAPGGSSSTSPLVVCSWWRPLMVTMILVEAARPLTSWSELRLRRPRPGQIRGQSPTHHKLTANC